VTIARSLYRRGIPVIVSPVTDYEPPIPSRAIHRTVRLPNHRKEPAAYAEALIDLVRAEGIDMVIPTGDGAMAAVAQNYERLSALSHVGCPPPDIMEKVLDKNLTLEAANRCGIPSPATQPVADAAEAVAVAERLRFPLIAKPGVRKGASTFKVRYFRSLAEVRASAEEDPESWSGALVQEYCPGVGVGIGVLMRDGAAVAMFQHRRLKELPYSGGVSVMAVAEAVNPDLGQASLALLRDIGWQGVAMVEYRFNPADGSYALMEVNGRYWGSLFTACRAGMDFPYYEWQLAHGEQPSIPATYKVGMRARWLTGDLLRLHDMLTSPPKGLEKPAKVKELVRFFTDFAPWVRGATWSFSDPKPALQEFSEVALSLAKSDAKALLRAILPGWLVAQLNTYRDLGSLRKAFLAMQLRRLLRLQPTRLGRRRRNTRAILFVCLGNVIRSPMSAEMLKGQLPPDKRAAMTITSAGVWQGLDPARPRQSPDEVKEVAREYGVPLDGHRSQPVTAELVARHDLIFVMDYRNEATMVTRFPESRDKLFLLGACIDKVPLSEYEIPDPWGGEKADIHRAFDTIKARIAGLAERL
jgi:predicted ATP-grasp superfamily ATP-dependent carboligase/protein-tyrosine-phosphatase